ncbi:MAG: nitroreductase/quinone reductase family protein [Ktedonobacteraceae bacterium]
MSEYNNFNDNVITEFRANSGKVEGYFTNTPLLLLTTTGAKSGQTRIAPLAYITDEDRIIIIASKAGAPTNPDWYHNLLAHPVATVEIGEERFQVQATVAAEPERTRLYAKAAEQMSNFAEYERQTSRKIPVVALTRVKTAN